LRAAIEIRAGDLVGFGGDRVDRAQRPSEERPGQRRERDRQRGNDEEEGPANGSTDSPTSSELAAPTSSDR
jgi:hypothetical protein